MESFGRAKKWIVSQGGTWHICPPSKKNSKNPHVISDVIYVMNNRGEKVKYVQCKRCGTKRSIALLLSDIKSYLAKIKPQEKIKETRDILAGFLYTLRSITEG